MKTIQIGQMAMAVIVFHLIFPAYHAVAQGNAAPQGVVKSVNGLAGQVSLVAGPGISIIPSADGLTIGAQTIPAQNVWAIQGNQAAPGDFLGTVNGVPLE